MKFNHRICKGCKCDHLQTIMIGGGYDVDYYCDLNGSEDEVADGCEHLQEYEAAAKKGQRERKNLNRRVARKAKKWK